MTPLTRHAAAGSGRAETDPIIFEHVWKRYQIGSMHDSLRDAIPALVRRLTGRNGRAADDGAFWAVKDVTFHVKPGETLGIVGHNGAGKSTILKLLSRITTQTTGRLTVKGRMAALIELGGGFHPDLSGAENIYLQGTMLGLTHREIARLYDSIVAFSDLGKFLQMPVKRYSSGMVVRLGFAIAAQIKPDVLLIDEVLAVGDLAFQQKCFKRIEELKRLRTTMIFISHNLEAVQKLCDRVLLLKAGQVQAEGEPSEMLRRYRSEVMPGKGAPGSAAVVSGPVTIRGVSLKNASNQAIETAAIGEPVRVDVDFDTSRPVIDPSFRVAIERLDGLVCHVARSRLDGLALKTLAGKGTVSLEYPALNLMPNAYQVIVEVHEGQNPIPLASMRQGCFFHVTSDRPEQGAMFLEHWWDWTPENGQPGT